MILKGTNKRWSCHENLIVVLCVGPALSLGCQFESEGTGDAPGGLGCSLDFHPTDLSVDPSVLVNGIAGATPPEQQDFIMLDEDFTVKWSFAYDSFNPGTKEFPYITHVRIHQDFETVWEIFVESDPIKRGDEGEDSVVVFGGLPQGLYTVVVDLDVENEVPECDSLFALLNDDMKMNFNVWSSNGPPQTPTPCQEAELPDCDD